MYIVRVCVWHETARQTQDAQSLWKFQLTLSFFFSFSRFFLFVTKNSKRRKWMTNNNNKWELRDVRKFYFSLLFFSSRLVDKEVAWSASTATACPDVNDSFAAQFLIVKFWQIIWFGGRCVSTVESCVAQFCFSDITIIRNRSYTHIRSLVRSNLQHNTPFSSVRYRYGIFFFCSDAFDTPTYSLAYFVHTHF